MYIVTRAFRDKNGVFGVGSVVDPTTVRSFKSRLQQKHIVDVSELNLDKWLTFFKNRYGIDLSDKLKEYLNEGGQSTDDAPAGPTGAVDSTPPEDPEESDGSDAAAKQEDW